MVVLPYSAVIFSSLFMWCASVMQRKSGQVLGHASLCDFPLKPNLHQACWADGEKINK